MSNKRRLAAAIAGLILIGLALAILIATPVASAKGKSSRRFKVHWNPPRVVATVAPGEVLTATATFSTTTTITNASFRFSDSLSDTVTVEPSAFALLEPGTDYQVTLQFTAPTEGKRRRYHGVMMVVDEVRAYAKPLKLRLHVASNP